MQILFNEDLTEVTKAGKKYRIDFEDNQNLTIEEKRLQVINKLLSEHRVHGVDHPSVIGDKQFITTAIIKTKKDGQDIYFLTANTQLKKPQNTRDCAEANAVIEAAQIYSVPKGELKILEIWVMGSPKDNDCDILWKGNLCMPCGSCLDLLRDYESPETKVHILPANDGSLDLKGKVKTHSMAQLYPLNKIQKPGNLLPKKDFFESSITCASYSPGLIKTVSSDITVINTLIMSQLHQIYSNNTKLAWAKIAIVATSNQNHYLGCELIDGSILSTPSAISNAIQNAAGEEIKAVYYLDVKFAQLRQDTYVVPMPSGDDLDRINKASHGEVTIYAFTPNDIKSFNEQHYDKFTIKDLMPMKFQSPKRSISQTSEIIEDMPRKINIAFDGIGNDRCSFVGKLASSREVANGNMANQGFAGRIKSQRSCCVVM